MCNFYRKFVYITTTCATYFSFVSKKNKYRNHFVTDAYPVGPSMQFLPNADEDEEDEI